MLSQSSREPRRKLVETRTYHFTLFLDENNTITGFDLTDRDEEHVLKCREGKLPIYYRLSNVERGYHNHNAAFHNGRFAAEPVIADIEARGHNLREEVRAKLVAAIKNAAAEAR
jgi:hypothetical protein